MPDMSQLFCGAGTVVVIALVVVLGIGMISVLCAAMLSSRIGQKERQIRNVRWSEEWEREQERRVKRN